MHTHIPKFPPPHAFTTPSPHGPFKPSPAHSDATVADWSDRTKAESAFVRSYQPSTCCQMCMPFWHDTSRASHLARQGWAGNSKNCAVDHLGRRGVEATRPIANGTTNGIGVPPPECPTHRQPHELRATWRRLRGACATWDEAPACLVLHDCWSLRRDHE